MKENEEHYLNELKQFGDSKQFSMKDMVVRDKEIAELIDAISTIRTYYPNKDYLNYLEIGCGNGYLAEQLVKELDIHNLSCIDKVPELIAEAKKRNLPDVMFCEGDVLKIDSPRSCMDIVISERCLINLKSRNDQKKAIDEIYRVLKPKGCFIMLEAFKDGLDNLNKARLELGLSEIKQPNHDIYFEKESFEYYIREMFSYFDVSHPESMLRNKPNFLSSYYFFTRVLYPKLVGEKNIKYNSMFSEFFREVPSFGNFSYIQLHILLKK